MEFDDVLAVLLGWLGTEIEVSLHGADGALPVLAAELHGRLERGDELGRGPRAEDALLFVLRASEETESGTFLPSQRAFRGGGWFDDHEEVLEVRSGVVQLLIARKAES